jgi:hypothetical protein
MTDRLNQESLDVIAAARNVDRAPPDSRARVRRGLVMKLGAAGLGASLPTAAVAATGAVSTFVKIALVVSAVGGVGAIAYRRYVPQTAAPIQTAPAAIVVPAVTPVAMPLPPATAVPAIEPIKVTPTSRKSVRRLAEADLNHLAEETAALVEVRAKMRTGLHREALLHLENYQARFQSGLLREESEAIRVQIWNEQGDHAQACRLARTFLKKWPRSPHGVRMRELCPGSSIPKP